MEEVLINVYEGGTLQYIDNIDEYIEIKRTDNYYGHSFLELTLPLTEKTINLLGTGVSDLTRTMKVITLSDEPQKAYFTEVPQLIFGREPSIFISCYSLSALLSFRVNKSQKEYNNVNYSSVAIDLVNANAINPTDTKRRIQRLVDYTTPLDENYSGLVTRGRKLDNQLEILLNNIEASYDIILSNEEMHFITYKGYDRTEGQMGNKPIILSQESENIISGTYTDDKSGYFNSFYTLGKGNNEVEFFLLDTNSLSNWERREAYIENSELKQTYDDGAGSKTLTNAQFQTALRQSANAELNTLNRVLNLQVEVSDFGQHVYNVDYFLGDKLTVDVGYLDLRFDMRLVKVTTTYGPKGMDRVIELGEATPNYYARIRKGLENGTKK